MCSRDVTGLSRPFFYFKCFAVYYSSVSHLFVVFFSYTSTRSSWLYSTRVLFYFVLSSLCARKKENFFQRCSDALVSRQKNFDASIISRQFWINHFSTFLSFLSLSRACDYTPPQKVREIERIKTHTHTHRERERERERVKKNVPVVFVFSADDNTNNVIFI